MIQASRLFQLSSRHPSRPFPSRETLRPLKLFGRKNIYDRTVVALLAHVTVNLARDVPGQIEKRHIFVLALAEIVIGQNSGCACPGCSARSSLSPASRRRPAAGAGQDRATSPGSQLAPERPCRRVDHVETRQLRFRRAFFSAMRVSARHIQQMPLKTVFGGIHLGEFGTG